MAGKKCPSLFFTIQMSKRSFWSQETTLEDYSQSQLEMPPKRSRTSNAITPYRKSMVASQFRKKRYKSKIPRAIQTRGTPDGYYEIPVRTLTRIYINTSTGFWDTNQTTGNSIGATGYQGIAFCSTLDNFVCFLGSGSVSASIFNSVPGFAGMQGVFDECKIVNEMYDIWVANQTPTATSTAAIIGAPDLFLIEDYNDATPPSTIDQVMQYSKMHRVPFDNGTYKIQYSPRIRVDLGAAADELGSTTTLAGVQAAGYQQLSKPGTTHFGLKGWIAIPSGSTNSHIYQLNIMRTQIRRYKINK